MFERTGYGADFLFSAPEGHTAGVHQLQVVYDNNFDSVLANQSACFCPKFKNGKAGGIVYIYRSVPQYFDTRHEPFPFERGQLSAFDFIAGDFASVDDETIDKLDIGHFEREDSHRRVIADSHVLCHRKDECRFSHSGTGCDNDEVGILPTRSNFVDVVKPGLQSAQSVASIGCYLNLSDSFAQYRVYLSNVFFQVTLGNFKEFPLGFLHKVIYVVGLVKGLVEYFAGKFD